MSTTTRDEIIAEEQKAVDRAYDCYEQRLAELTGGSIASASASGKNSVANRKDTEDKAAEYAGLGDASLVTVTRRWPVQSTSDIAPRTAASPTRRLVGHRWPSDHSRNGEPQ
jgi:hypothetical protein